MIITAAGRPGGRAVAIIGLLLACAAAPQRLCAQLPRDSALASLVAAERGFAVYADTANIPASFVWALRDDAITLTGDGVKLMKPIYAARRPGPARLAWGPSVADVSADGSMGITMGPWEWRPARDSAVAARGHFMTIWLRGTDRWQVALDLGVSGDTTARLDEPLFLHAAGVTGSASLDPVMAEDRRISGGDWVRKLKRVTSPDARILREGVPMATGREGVTGAAGVQFHPLGGRVATSGDLAATWGTFEAGATKGAYVRFWKRTVDGWRVVVDRMGE